MKNNSANVILIQDWGDGKNKITVEASEKDILKAIRYVRVVIYYLGLTLLELQSGISILKKYKNI
jgi:hypothetical protein